MSNANTPFPNVNKLFLFSRDELANEEKTTFKATEVQHLPPKLSLINPYPPLWFPQAHRLPPHCSQINFFHSYTDTLLSGGPPQAARNAACEREISAWEQEQAAPKTNYGIRLREPQVARTRHSFFTVNTPLLCPNTPLLPRPPGG